MGNETAVSNQATSQILEEKATTQTNEKEPSYVYKNGVKLGPRHAPGKDVLVKFSKVHRLMMMVFFTVNRSLSLCIFALLASYFTVDKWMAVLLTLLAAMTCSDLIAGTIHWAGDTYGTLPIWVENDGAFLLNYLRRNREHHIDPSSVTRYDLWESNGNVHCAFSILLGLLPHSLVLYTSTPDQIRAKYILHVFCILTTFLGSVSPMIHKWSHTYFGLPRWIRFLQRCHLILPPRHHAKHHFVPHNTFYCITTGWVDYPFEYFGVWRKLEAAIEYVFGIKPRVDDIAWNKTMGFISDHPDRAGKERVIEYSEMEDCKSK